LKEKNKEHETKSNNRKQRLTQRHNEFMKGYYQIRISGKG